MQRPAGRDIPDPLFPRNIERVRSHLLVPVNFRFANRHQHCSDDVMEYLSMFLGTAYPETRRQLRKEDSIGLRTRPQSEKKRPVATAPCPLIRLAKRLLQCTARCRFRRSKAARRILAHWFGHCLWYDWQNLRRNYTSHC